MIVNRLSAILGERRMSQRALQAQTGLSYTTISRLYNDHMERFDKDTLDKLCVALGVTVCDLLEYRP